MVSTAIHGMANGSRDNRPPETDYPDGLPRLVQLFPTDGCKGDTTIE